MPLQFVVPMERDGWCVRDFLRSCGVSSTAIRAAKRTPPGIQADGVPVHTNAFVKAGMRILLPEVPEASPEIAAQDIPLTIPWEDDNAAVVEKPAGMAVHPTLNYADGTLANAWMGELVRRGTQGAFHPVYRLDKDTSGLLLLAKSGAVQPFLIRSCRKLYAAILTGVPPQSTGVCEGNIGRVPDSIILRQVCAEGEPARTHWQVLAQNGAYSLAVFRLETGRTHQIRVHMSHMGYPLAGDDLYGGEKSGAFPRQALHCTALCFTTPAGETVRLQSPFPQQLLAAAGLEEAAAALRQVCEAFFEIKYPG